MHATFARVASHQPLRVKRTPVFPFHLPLPDRKFTSYEKANGVLFVLCQLVAHDRNDDTKREREFGGSVQ